MDIRAYDLELLESGFAGVGYRQDHPDITPGGRLHTVLMVPSFTSIILNDLVAVSLALLNGVSNESVPAYPFSWVHATNGLLVLETWDGKRAKEPVAANRFVRYKLSVYRATK